MNWLLIFSSLFVGLAVTRFASRHSSLPPSFVSSFITTHFTRPSENPKVLFTHFLRQKHPNSQIVPILPESDAVFPIFEYLESKGIPFTLPSFEGEHGSDSRQYYALGVNSKDGISWKMLAGQAEFEYDGVQFKYYRFTLRDYQTPFFDALIYDLPPSTLASPAELDSLTEKLVTGIYNFGANVRNQIWIFEAGQWYKSSELYHSIQNSSFDDIVLEDEFIDGLRRDTRSFFENKDVYRSLGIAWKRGILLLGPPGNGKTESIKALLNEMKDYPALYVKSFTTQQGPEHGIRTIFQHARNHSPCILILEDLDSMVANEVRSFFLNELDGLAQNDGILTIATTNHPERIDDAILNRPSRFDVKYTFDLPDFELRKAYATKWILKTQKKHKKMIRFKRDVNELAHEIANRTEGWSFAFLKELFTSFLLRLAHDSKNPSTSFSDETLLLLTDHLSNQIMRLGPNAFAEFLPSAPPSSRRRPGLVQFATPV